MSRAAWVGLLLLGAAFGLVAFLATRGLPEESRAALAQVRDARAGALKTVADGEAELARLVAADPGYLADQPEVTAARSQLSSLRTDLTAQNAAFEAEASRYEAADQYGDRFRVDALARQQTEYVAAQSAGASAALAEVRALVAYKADAEKYAGLAQAAANRLPELGDTAGLGALLALKAADCAEARPKLAARVEAIGAQAERLRADHARFLEIRGAVPLDYAAAGRLAVQLQKGAEALAAARTALAADLESLARSEDRVLIDMDDDGGQYRHKYREVVDGKATETDWRPVSYAEYLRHTDHLGLVIRSKPECATESEAQTNPAPPGYHYVGNARYGQWVDRGGSSVWEFYGKYALLRDLLFGPGYLPVSRVAYTDYSSSARARSPWYGSNREFGTSGSTTRVRYSTSTAIKRRTEAAAPSRSYSDSTYRSGSGSSSSGSSGAARKTFSTSSYRSGSSSSGSSRSGSYRSSSYRSSSRSGGGK